MTSDEQVELLRREFSDLLDRMALGGSDPMVVAAALGSALTLFLTARIDPAAPALWFGGMAVMTGYKALADG